MAQVENAIRAGITAVLEKRVKHIGDEETVYTGIPSTLIKELMEAIEKNY